MVPTSSGGLYCCGAAACPLAPPAALRVHPRIRRPRRLFWQRVGGVAVAAGLGPSSRPRQPWQKGLVLPGLQPGARPLLPPPLLPAQAHSPLSQRRRRACLHEWQACRAQELLLVLTLCHGH